MTITSGDQSVSVREKICFKPLQCAFVIGGFKFVIQFQNYLFPKFEFNGKTCDYLFRR